MIKIPVVRSEFRTDVYVSSAQYMSLIYDLEFTREELGDVFRLVTGVDETFLAKVEAAVAQKKTGARVLTTLRKAFSAAYEKSLLTFREEMRTARSILSASSVLDSEYVTFEQDGRIGANYKTTEDRWTMDVTCSLYATARLVKNVFVGVEFVVSSTGFCGNKNDPVVSTVDEAMQILRFFSDWELALKADDEMRRRKNVAEDLDRVEMTLDLLALAGVDLFAV